MEHLRFKFARYGGVATVSFGGEADELECLLACSDAGLFNALYT
jgi:hypothetical protein